MSRDDGRTSRRITWRPGTALQVVLGAAFAGSAIGLVFGLVSLNRPLANAAVFYVLGAVVAAALAAVAVVLGRAVARASGRRRGRRS